MQLKYLLIKRMQARKHINPTRVIALAFLAIIAVGTALLLLPAASRDGHCCGFMTAAFTATSATCVTGLILADTWTQWSGFGQVVIILLIQTGGLGFMTIVSVFSFMVRRRFTLRERMLMSQALNLTEMDGVVRLVRHILIGTLGFELCGAVVLSCCFVRDFGLWGGIARGLFHAISAFCNAGFDLLGVKEPFCSMMGYADDPVVMITLMVLVLVGGLGFIVWEDILGYKKNRRLSVYTRLVLISGGVLFIAGAVFFFLAEYDNPATMGKMGVGEKLLAACFQSVTCRTAGFDALGQGALGDSSKVFSMMLMFIGGASGSTAGGVKTVTITVLILSALAVARGRDQVTVFGRTIPTEQIINAMSVVFLVFVLAAGGAVFISSSMDVPFIDAMYETVSALGTVGTTTGLTTSLNLPAQILIMIYMFFGRVGIMTIGIAFLINKRDKAKIKYPTGRVMIG